MNDKPTIYEIYQLADQPIFRIKMWRRSRFRCRWVSAWFRHPDHRNIVEGKTEGEMREVVARLEHRDYLNHLRQQNAWRAIR